MMRPLITLLTDFGTANHYVAAMKGVMTCICAEAQFVDITHEIEPYAIAEAAFTLNQAWKYFPEGTVHLVVVDPGVGSSRRPVLAEAAGHRFVAPDNGVLTMALETASERTIREITNRKYFRTPVSQTFHGRDIFAPVAAQLASGIAAAEFGHPIDDYVLLDLLSEARRTADGSWEGSVLNVDRYGNVVTSLPVDLIEKEGLNRVSDWRIEIGSGIVTTLVPSYSEGRSAGIFAIAGSSGYLEVSIDQGSAARLAGVRTGYPVRLRRTGCMP